MKRIIIYIISAISLIACEDDVDVKDLGIEPKMVLYCYLSPMFDTTSVFLSNSQPIFSSETNDLAVIKNATVELSNNGKTWIKCKYDNIKERYILTKTDFPILEGKTYYIRAKAPGFKETISSSCTVPFYRNIELKIENKESNENVIETNISWKDYAGESNYYSFSVYEIYETFDYMSDEMFKDLYTYYIYDSETGSYIFSDEEKDGYDLSVKTSFDNEKSSDTILLSINQTTKDYYLYENSLNNYYLSESFFGMVEPTLLYNNIKNGYGLFTAFVFKTFQYDIKNNKIEAYIIP
ncbi:MAG: hypothetical protein BWY27_00161 [Bacteroidetes bacterium ADurb.Bin234]|jgi:hypothetical protein|nr:MAG: hypothetical protein BWY27_00161 [Bacteroidetes bacterium ADurb.Bin234]